MDSHISAEPMTPVLDEKNKTTRVNIHEDIESDAGIEKPVWKPGFRAQFPTVGALALLTALICACSALAVLLVSDGKSENHLPWRWLAPSVILSGLNSVANICLTVAIGNGIAIAWWRRTLKGASIEDLHRSWSFSTSVLELVFSAKYFNVIALTALVTKISIADSMLLQRASTTVPTFDDPQDIARVMVNTATTFPVTGRHLMGADETAEVLSSGMAQAIQSWQMNGGTYKLGANFTGCEGICNLKMPAIGLGFNCGETEQLSIDMLAVLRNSSTTTEVPLFDIDFKMDYRPFPGTGLNSTIISMDLLWTYTEEEGSIQSTGRAAPGQNVSLSCPGWRLTRHCDIYPALLNYSVQVTALGNNPKTQRSTSDGTSDNDSPSIQLSYDPNYIATESWGYDYNVTLQQLPDHPVIHPIYLPPQSNNTLTYLGGIKKALDMHLSAKATVRNVSYTEGFMLSQNETAASWLSNQPGDYQCDFQYGAPIWDSRSNRSDFSLNPDIISSLNDVMFPIAIGEFDSSAQAYDDSSIVAYQMSELAALQGTIQKEAVHFQSHIPFVVAAFLCMVLCICLVLPSFWGYWQLGRKVTLGPVEIAHAFRSPMTAPPSDDPAAVAKTNGTIKEIIEEVGSRQVKFGQIVDGDAKGVLGVAEPEHVQRVHPKIGAAKSELAEMFAPHHVKK